MDSNLSALIDAIKGATDRQELIERLAQDFGWSKTTVQTYLAKGKLTEMVHLRGAKLAAARLVPAAVECEVVENRSGYMRAFDWLAILTPKRIWNEDVGDAIETITAMERAGCSRFKLRAKVASTYFWVLVAVIAV
jgi:hypothetical protein